ncbi:helix-turn-helix transcriptional regulator [Roseiconus nitratireducens]|nr:LuxR C-terminal-related transcriptional regulator [Roseiconus nitratireducens]
MSNRLRIADYRGVYELVGECKELGADPMAWRDHLHHRARELFRAQIAIYTESDRVDNPGVKDWLRINVHLDSGWPCESDRRAMFRLYDTGRPDCDGSPMVDSPAALRVASRQDSISDAEWYQGFFFNEFIRPAHMDDAIMMQHRLGNEVRMLVLQRCEHDKHFTRRDVRRLRLLGIELGRAFGRSLAARDDMGVTELPRRLQQVLLCLLEGDNEKQVSLRLNLSHHTVHDYVKMLHRRFSVQSRGELLAKCSPFKRVLEQLVRAPRENS